MLRDSLRGSAVASRGSVSMTILWACVAVHLAILLLDRAGVLSAARVVDYFGISREGIFHYFRLHQFVTAALLHGGLMHLVFNMLALWMLGPAVESTLGRARYVWFSVFCAVTGFGGFLWFSPGGHAVSIGYSGVLFGIMVAQAIYFPHNRIFLFGLFPLRMRNAVLLLGAIELYLTIAPSHGGVANSAHLFGALGALAFLKLPMSVRLGRRPAGRPGSSRAPDVPRPDRAALARERASAAIADALRSAAANRLREAAGQLRAMRVPLQLRPLVGEVRRLVEAEECCAAGGGDGASARMEALACTLWAALDEKGLHAALAPLATIGLRHGDRVTPLVLQVLGRPGLPEPARRELEVVFVEAGPAGIELLMAALANPATPSEAVSCLQTLLPAVGLGRHAAVLVRFFARAGQEERERLAQALAAMRGNTAGRLLELLAGVADRLPADWRLARAVQAKVGSHLLERIAVRWAAGGHRAAQTVLTRLYGHDPATFR